MRSLRELNQEVQNKTPEEIIAWAFKFSQRTLTSTTFGNKSAALLHMVTRQHPRATILWIDTGYNTPATYRFAEKLIQALNLNMQVYVPEMTTVRRNVIMGGIPNIAHPLHEEFTRQVKLEPFKRATDILDPPLWITGIRRSQSTYRESLDVISMTKSGILKVAPFLNCQDEKIDSYLETHQLPNEPDYFDPTKVQDNRECGLHTRM